MPESGPVGVGVIGAGMISNTYLEHLTSFPDLRVLVVGDLDQARAGAQAEKYLRPRRPATTMRCSRTPTSNSS